MKKINPNPKKVLTLNKVTVSMFSNNTPATKNGAKNAPFSVNNTTSITCVTSITI